MNVTEEERTKAQAIAKDILNKFQSDGLTEKEARLVVNWLDIYLTECIKLNHADVKLNIPSVVCSDEGGVL